MECLILLAIFALLALAVINQDHLYHNAIRRRFGLKEETFLERLKRRRAKWAEK